MEDQQGGLSTGRSRRSTAGNRMRELLEQERERLEAKRGNEEDEMFKEEEGDVDFEARAEEEGEEDIIDSDFDQSSEEGEEGKEGDDDDLEGEREIEEEERAARKASRIKAAPIGVRKPVITAPSSRLSSSKKTANGQVAASTSSPLLSSSSAVKRISFASGSAPGDIQRSSKRKSTMNATLTVQARLKLEEKRRLEASERAIPKRKKIRLSQADRIAEALEMEEQNRESLKKYLELEEERRERDRRRGKRGIDGPWIRYRSVGEDCNNAQKRLIHTVSKKEVAAKERPIVTNDAITVDPVMAAREATKKERVVHNERTLSDRPKDSTSEVVEGVNTSQAQSTSAPTEAEQSIIHDEAEQSMTHDEASNQHSRTTTATDTVMTEREEEIQGERLNAEPDQGEVSVAQESILELGHGKSADMDVIVSDEQAIVFDVAEKENGKKKETMTVKLTPDLEGRTYLSLHQLPPDTPWNMIWSYILGSQVDWSHYPFVPSRNRPLRPRQSVCPITGLPAIYKDPRNGIAYANKEAYQALTRVMSGQYLWSGKEIVAADSIEQQQQHNYDPLDMGCWLDDIKESGACNVLDIAANKFIAPPTVLYRPKGAVAPGDEQAIIAAAQALPAGTTRSGGRRAAGSTTGN